MMGLTRADTMELTLWEYEARLWHWNEAHMVEGGDAPDIDDTMALLDRINADPRLTGKPNLQAIPERP